MPRIAYFGPQGTFTEQAAMRFEGELVPFDTIPLAVAAVREGSVEFACVPIENSVEGAVPATLDVLIRDEPVVAVAETVLDVKFSILVRPGTTEIKTIASHPHALAQVRDWIAEELPGVTSIATSSTAGAAAAVERGEFDAAVTAPVAVHHYKLDEYATGILDVADARTRFLLLRRPGQLPRPTGADRTSVVVTTPNRVGVLSELLTELALRGINLTGLESRPTKGKLGTYRFYIDVEGHIAEPRIGDALAALHRHSHEIRFLGSFPKADHEPVEAHNEEFAAAAAWVDAVRKGERG